jgi:hypothetical protein
LLHLRPRSPEAQGVRVMAEPAIPRFIEQVLERASELGLVARWSREFGFISIHDPTTGEWHDIPMKEAPVWAKWEAHKRKELSKFGGVVTQMLTAREMEEIWQEERREMRETPGMTKHGNVYEDYLEEDD